MKEICQVNIKNKKSNFYQVDKNLIFFERIDRYDFSKSVIETFAQNWFIAFLTKAPASLEIRNGNNFLTVKSPMGIIIPPFSIIEWRIGIGDLEWKGFFSKISFSVRNFNRPCTFSNFCIPTSNTELKNLTDKIIVDHEINISKDNSWLSEKTKEIIDLQFRDDFKIEEIA